MILFVLVYYNGLNNNNKQELPPTTGHRPNNRLAPGQGFHRQKIAYGDLVLMYVGLYVVT